HPSDAYVFTMKMEILLESTLNKLMVGIRRASLMLEILSRRFFLKLNLSDHRKKVVVIEDVIRRDLHLDDADGVECLSNEEIFAELAHMGYEKPPPQAEILQGVLLCTIEVLDLYTCSKVPELEHDKYTQALEILKLKKRGRIDQDFSAATKDVNAAEPTVFDDEEMAQRLHDEEVEKTAARDKQEKDNLERA
nr:hypothetical protein [Tanacetum cinerariifolium]